MTPRTKALLWSVAGVYLVVRSYQGSRHSSSDLSWFTPYAWLLLAGIAFLSALQFYRNREFARRPSPTAEHITRAEKTLFWTFGVPVIFVGLAVIGVGCWLAWGQWIKVTQWPRTEAVLISKDISKGGARLVFQYEVGGRRVTGLGFRWGAEKTVRAALEAYEPGTIQKISYDPEDPSQVEPVLRYTWEQFTGPISAAVIGLFLVAGGVVVYRWSH